ncbi:hypothetical protein [Streptomyces sp. R44]|uniref:Uncharacterized protein n=1 Tax=Streptomyces sp. R44 TaxID=3238633 RepID=A0AB39TC30_9ACTN
MPAAVLEGLRRRRHAEAAALLERCVRDYERIYGPGYRRQRSAEEKPAWLRDDTGHAF